MRSTAPPPSNHPAARSSKPSRETLASQNSHSDAPAQTTASPSAASVFDVVNAIEDQQRRIGSELHDNLCQNLAGIAALSAALERTLSAEQHRVAQAGLREITQLLNGAVGDARDIARGLFATDLAQSSLVAELKRLRDDAEHRFRVACTARFSEHLNELAPETELHLLRIAQEAVSNAILHGQASAVHLALTQSTTQTQLSVIDDGVGFLTDAYSPGLGLRSMRYRAALIGATLNVRQRLRGGVEVLCALALPPTEQATNNRAQP